MIPRSHWHSSHDSATHGFCGGFGAVGDLKFGEDGAMRATPALDLSARLDTWWERGLIGVTTHPDFPRTPHVFLLDARRSVQYIGAIDDNPESPASAKNRWVEAALEALLRGERPTMDYTRAVGCTVKKKP